MLSPQVGAGSPKSMDNKLSHPSYLCNIVKEENVSLVNSASNSNHSVGDEEQDTSKLPISSCWSGYSYIVVVMGMGVEERS